MAERSAHVPPIPLTMPFYDPALPAPDARDSAPSPASSHR